MKQKLLVIHPHGDFFHNPSLIGIVEILSAEWEVTVASPIFLGNASCGPADGPRFTMYNKRLMFIVLSFAGLLPRLVSKIVFQFLLKQTARLIIGVDAEGLRLASYAANAWGACYVLLSYEIAFEDELNDGSKVNEIKYSKGVSFAICQGGERSKQLSAQNKIPRSNIIDIPVSPIGYPCLGGDDSRRNVRLSLGVKEEFVVIACGSLSKWSMIDELVQSARSWPSNWALVVHNRYGRDHIYGTSLFEGRPPNVYFSSMQYATTDSLSPLLKASDLGISLYRPTYDNKWEGKNLEFIGLSSGKTAVYLQHSLPVLSYGNPEYGELITSYNAGFDVIDISYIPQILFSLCHEKIKDLSRGASKLYREKIDAANYAPTLVSACSLLK